GSGDGSLVAPIAAGIGAVALVGAGAFFVRSRKKPGRLASTPTEHQVPPPAPYPTVRAFAGKGVHKVTSSGRGVVVGVRVVSREPSSTQISLTGEHGDQ
ncbi:MAG: hypothetical protein QOJ74_395, partial [Ilumatobacteraceae bacterium]|nr:hypothetical protein [Ilumatobacteraceae bacterium]